MSVSLALAITSLWMPQVSVCIIEHNYTDFLLQQLISSVTKLKMHAYTNDQLVSPSEDQGGNSSRQRRNATYICTTLHLHSIRALKSCLHRTKHHYFDHAKCHVTHALLGKGCITFNLLLFEPSFLPLPLLQQACSAASGVEPAHRCSKIEPGLHQKQHQILCLTCTCLLTICLHGTMFILCAHHNYSISMNQL